MTMRSLASYNDFEFAKLIWFKQIYHLEVKNTIIGTKPFFNKMMSSKKVNVNLLNDMYNLLVKYYNMAYNDLYFFLIEKISWNQGHFSRRIIVWP